MQKNFEFRITATRPIGYHTTKTVKIKKGAIALAPHRLNVNVLLSNSTFLLF